MLSSEHCDRSELALAKINLAIALYNEPDLPASQRRHNSNRARAKRTPAPLHSRFDRKIASSHGRGHWPVPTGLED
jgi:hypothetical protein